VGEEAEGELMWLEEEYEAAMKHLRALVAQGPCHNTNYCDAPEDCIYCGVWLEMPEMHKPDCPYLAAKQFLEEIDAPQAQ
jgi:hypothetical protein